MLTWGISDYEGNERYEMALQFPSEDYRDEKTNKFLQVTEDFENKIKEDALKIQRNGLENNIRVWMYLKLMDSNVKIHEK